MKLSALSTALVLVALFSLQGCAVLVGAGVATGIMVANDRRTSGTILDDKVIKNKVATLINEKYEDEVQVNLTSYNRVVLLYGQVPSQDIVDDIGSMALETQNVRDVQNEIMIAGASSFVARSNDSLLTSKVKSRLMKNDDVKANHVKVVTDGGSVYLMGLVTRSEAAAATETAATKSGVKRVVKVFEFLD
jgi:osmotically-inducible protein OsmY